MELRQYHTTNHIMYDRVTARAQRRRADSTPGLESGLAGFLTIDELIALARGLTAGLAFGRSAAIRTGRQDEVLWRTRLFLSLNRLATDLDTKRGGTDAYMWDGARQVGRPNDADLQL